MGGQIATLTGSEGGEGGEATTQSAQEVLSSYVDVYANFAYAIIGIGILILILNKPFNKLMHGVK